MCVHKWIYLVYAGHNHLFDVVYIIVRVCMFKK